MLLGTSGGLLVVSVDVDSEPTTGQGSQASDAATLQLVELLDRRRIPATFALTHPGTTSLSRAIASGRSGHELALLGDGSGACPEPGASGAARRRVVDWPKSRADAVCARTVVASSPSR